MINNINKIKKKLLKINIINFFLKIGNQKRFLKNKYLINFCIIKTWIKIKIINNFFFVFGYSKSLLISGIIKILFKIINNNNIKNVFIILNFNILKIINIFLTNNKINNINNIIYYIINFLKYYENNIFF